MASQFSIPAHPGDAVSLIVLVEDSRAMAEKWNYVRENYLPVLLESLRAVDMSVPMRVWWLTSSPTFAPFTTSITEVDQCKDIPPLDIGHQSDIIISTSTIRRSMNIYTGSYKQRRSNQHLLIIAASPLLGGGEGPSPMQSGIDPWLGIALALCQERLRLHLILGHDSGTKTFSELFGRALYMQSLVSVTPWFHVDTSRFVIYLAGNSLQRNTTGSSLSLNQSSETRSTSPGSHEDLAIPGSVSLPPSPTHQSRPSSSRRSSLSSTLGSRTDRDSTHDALGLVSYLQRMHGLTKKRSYGVKAAKRSPPGDLRGVHGARPILPRLDLSTPPQTPSALQRGDDTNPGVHAPPLPSVPHRSSTSPDTRRARSRGPWLPASLPGSSSDSPSDSTTAALLSLESMTPRLTEFHTMDYPSRSSLVDRPHHSRHSARGSEFLQALAYHNAIPRSPDWSHSQTSSYEHFSAMLTPSDVHLTPPMSGDFGMTSHYPMGSSGMPRQSDSYSSTPLGSQTSSPLPSPSLTAPASPTDNTENQPFIVTPEYEAFVAARFEEAVRSGEMQASMTSNFAEGVSSPQSYKTSPPNPQGEYDLYALPQSTQHSSVSQEAGYLYEQRGDMSSQFASTTKEWDDMRNYMYDTTEYGASPSGSWFPS